MFKCNYLFTWIKDDGIHRYKRKMWGIEKTQNSYTAGTWVGDKMNLLDEVGKWWLPWNPMSAEIKHDQRMFVSMLQEEPYVYKVSKIKNTAPKGIISITAKQDKFNSDKDYVNLETGEMYADYYSSTIVPEEVLPKTETVTDTIFIEAKTYNIRINGGSKVLYVKILDKDNNDITNNYNNEDLIWSFKLKNDKEDITSLILEDSTYNETNKDEFKYKFKFLGDEMYLNEIITITLKINELSASADLNIIS